MLRTGIEVYEMKIHTWEAMAATLNPSPLFEAVAAFAKELAIQDRDLCPAANRLPPIPFRAVSDQEIALEQIDAKEL